MGGFQIVKFITENTVEVVPSFWITQENGQSVCLWPNSPLPNKIIAAIRNQEQPKCDWKTFHVEVLSKHVYESFAVASSKTNKATYTSCLESDAENVGINYNIPAKRPRKKNKRYLDSSSDEDFLQESPSRTSIKIQLENTSRSNFPTPPQIIKAQGLPEVTLPQARAQVTKNLTKHLGDVGPSINKESQSTKDKDNIPSVSSSGCSHECSHAKEYSQVIRLLHVINTRSQEQSELLTTLLNRDISTQYPIRPTEDPEEVVFDIPTNTEHEFLQLNARITENKKEKEALVTKLLHVGGNSAKDLIKRIMTKIVNDNVLKEYSWIGGKGKKKFGLLKMAEVIKDVCKLNKETKECSEKNIEGIISIYLTKATDRCNRKLKKQADGAQTNEEVTQNESVI